MMKRKEFMLGAIAGLTFAAAATAGGVIDWPSANAGPVAGFTGRLTPDNGGAGLAFAPPQGAPLSFADIFQQVAPAVVQINVESRVEAPATARIPGLPFEVPNPQAEPEGESGRTALGAGSGFFISRDGYIVTNNHVVANAIEISVVLADERELRARVVGRDPATDLAVLKVEGSDFPFVEFEEGAQPRVGDWVIAVGNPFGLGGTATAGIVSGLGRQNIDPDHNAGYVDFLQIDAAINTGNSGGPTFDVYGRVIGVNSAIYSLSGGSVGIGFAIPASVAKPITESLIRNGSVERGYVGLTLATFDANRWEAYGQSRDFDGAYVDAVTAGGPADQAGVEAGDILVGVDGRTIADSTEATRRVAQARPGSTIRLEIIRDGRRRTINVRSGTRPSEDELRASTGGTAPSLSDSETAPESQAQTLEGMTVAPLSPAIRRRFQIADTVAGVVIVSVEDTGPAARARLLRPGIVITRAGNRTVASVADLNAVILEAKRAGRPSILLFLSARGQRGTEVLRFADD